MEDEIKLSDLASRFSIREELAKKMLLEWSNANGIIVMRESEGDGTVYIQKDLFAELERGEELFDSFVCDQEYILRNKINQGRDYSQAYIYFLLEEDYVVYIGQSVSLSPRLATHRTDKYFDSVAVCQVHKSLLDIAEQANIIHYNPKLNGTMWNPKSVFKRILWLCDL